MHKGISVWSFPKYPLEEIFRLARKYGYEGVEIALDVSGELGLSSEKSDIYKIKELSQKYNIKLYSVSSGLYWTYSLTANDKAIREKALSIARKQLDIASMLSCESILIIPGLVGSYWDPSAEIIPYDIAYNRALEAFGELAVYAQSSGVIIGVENVWNKFLTSPFDMRNFIDEIKSPFVQVYFDVGNVLIDGYPEHWISILGERITKVHIKDYRVSVGGLDGFVDLLTGDVNYPSVIEALKNIGYDGWITAEVPVYSDYPEASLQNTSNSMDRILGRV